MSEPARNRFDAVVVYNRLICREHYVLRLRILGDFPPTQPGQFVQLGCRQPDRAMDLDVLCGRDIEWRPGEAPRFDQPEVRRPLALLRRPFSLAGRGDTEGVSGKGTWIDIIHRVVGVGTQWLAELRGGDAVDLIGPLGNAFELPRHKCMGLLVGGGVGLPPMFYLAQRLKQAGWDAVGFVGALTKNLLAVTWDDAVAPDTEGLPKLSVAQFAQHGYPTVISTDDGSHGLRGRITDGLLRVFDHLPEASMRNAVVFTCGPEPMMHAVADLAEQRGVDCQVCLEQAMACGMGTCQSCVVRIEDHDAPHAMTDDGRPWRYRLACTDGPVFAAQDVVW